MTVPTGGSRIQTGTVCIQRRLGTRGRLGVDIDSGPDYFWVTLLDAAFAGAFLAAAQLSGLGRRFLAGQPSWKQLDADQLGGTLTDRAGLRCDRTNASWVAPPAWST